MIPLPLKVTGLTITYPGLGRADNPITVVQGLNLEVNPGQFCCLAGRSGSGKTSLITHLSGMYLPPPQTVWWGDTDLATLSESEAAQLRRTQVGYLDQDSALIDELTCLENVLLPLVPQGRSTVRRSKSRAIENLESLGLGQWLNARPHQISGGMRQRVVLAQLLTAQTPVILADEPTASLDRQWANTVIAVLEKHVASGGTVIAASHDPEVAKAADFVIEVESALSKTH